MSRIITCEQVSNGHPDKLCDQIADAVVTDCLQHDRNSRVAIECFAKDNRIIIAGELTSQHRPDYRKLVYEVFDRIGWEKLNYGDPTHVGPEIAVLVKEQSSDIALGVDKGGAGDQGMMFGYATNVTIPIGVTNIEHGTFSNCVGLTDVGIPESVKSISTFAFYNCSNLANMRIPEGVTIIEENAFCGCSKLSDIIIPDSVTQISSAAFSRCSKLTIHAPAGSYAERYAEEKNIPFVALTV